MSEWRYKLETVQRRSLEQRLNELGREQWELVSISWGTLCDVALKRRYEPTFEEMFDRNA